VDKLNKLLFIPAPHVSGDVSLTVDVTVQDSVGGPVNTETTQVDFHVRAVTDRPTGSAPVITVVTDEDVPVGIALAWDLTDQDGSEYDSIQISQVPYGASFSEGLECGRNDGGKIWCIGGLRGCCQGVVIVLSGCWSW